MVASSLPAPDTRTPAFQGLFPVFRYEEKMLIGGMPPAVRVAWLLPTCTLPLTRMVSEEPSSTTQPLPPPRYSKSPSTSSTTCPPDTRKAPDEETFTLEVLIKVASWPNSSTECVV